MLSCYHFMMFTGFLDDLQSRTNLGWSLAAAVGLLLVFNVVIIMMVNIMELKRKFTLWKMRRAALNAKKLKLNQ